MMKQCENGHIYDDAKSQFCPLCKELSTDYEGRCGNCHKFIGEDEYCRYCGTKKGEGKFEPYENFIPCVYGSPNTYIHKCKECGIEFQSSGMGAGPNYCYKCGNKVTCEKEFNNLSNIQGLQRTPYERGFMTVDDFESKDNFIPCVYGSPERMSGAYRKSKKRIRNPKNNKSLLWLLLAVGILVCVELIVLILLNVN